MRDWKRWIRKNIREETLEKKRYNKNKIGRENINIQIKRWKRENIRYERLEEKKRHVPGEADEKSVR